MKPLKLIAISALAVSLLSVNANAWGDREQGALLGVVGTLLVPSVIGGFSNLNNSHESYNPQPTNVVNYHYDYDNRPKRKPHRRYHEQNDLQKVIIIDRHGRETTYFVEKGSDTIVIKR